MTLRLIVFVVALSCVALCASAGGRWIFGPGASTRDRLLGALGGGIAGAAMFLIAADIWELTGRITGNLR